MYAVKQIPDETISLDIHFQDDLTPSNIATLSTELVITLLPTLICIIIHIYKILLKVPFNVTFEMIYSCSRLM